MLSKIALIALPDMAVFEFGVLCEVFGIDRSDDGLRPFDFTVVAADPGPVALPHGMSLAVEHGLGAAADADLIAVPAARIGVPTDPRVLDVLRAAHARGAWVLSVCSGAFVLAEAGFDRDTFHTFLAVTTLFALAHAYALVDEDTAILLFSVFMVLIAASLVVAAVGMFRGPAGLPRWATLAAGVWPLATIPAGAAISELAHFGAIAVWGVTWIVLGATMIRASRR